MPQEVEPLTITIAQFKRMTGLGHTKTYQLIREGRLVSTKVDARRLIDFQSAKKLVKPQQTDVAA